MLHYGPLSNNRLILLVGIMGRTDLMGDPYMGLGPIYGLWVIWEKIDAIKRYGSPIYGFGPIWVWERKKKYFYLLKALN